MTQWQPPTPWSSRSPSRRCHPFMTTTRRCYCLRWGGGTGHFFLSSGSFLFSPATMQAMHKGAHQMIAALACSNRRQVSADRSRVMCQPTPRPISHGRKLFAIIFASAWRRVQEAEVRKTFNFVCRKHSLTMIIWICTFLQLPRFLYVGPTWGVWRTQYN